MSKAPLNLLLITRTSLGYSTMHSMDRISVWPNYLYDNVFQGASYSYPKEGLLADKLKALSGNTQPRKLLSFLLMSKAESLVIINKKSCYY